MARTKKGDTTGKTANPIHGLAEAGDAIVVCRSDGSTDLFLLDIDHRGLLARLMRGAEMSDSEMGQLLAAHRAMVLFRASRNDRLMATLAEAMDDPVIPPVPGGGIAH